jgi:hypothetical protein
MNRKDIIKSKIPEIETKIRSLGHKIDIKKLHKGIGNHNYASLICERCNIKIDARVFCIDKNEYNCEIYIGREWVRLNYLNIKHLYCEAIKVLL